MRSILMIVIMLVLVGCNKPDNGEGKLDSTAHNGVSNTLLPTSEELKSQDHNGQYIQVVNTHRPDYNEYYKQWKRVNGEPEHEEHTLTTKTEPVEIYLDDLTFGEAFRIEYCAKGEGHTFWWNKQEYTTNLLISDNPSVDEE